jgi:ferredoxin
VHVRLPGERYQAQLVAARSAGPMVEIRVDGTVVEAPAGASILAACDSVGIYVPRLCAYPGLSCCAGSGLGGSECGLCAVRLGDGDVALACRTGAATGMEVTTRDDDLVALRLRRLAEILERHPHVCLTCPQREGCARDSCTFGYPAEARCCDELGRCEIGKLYAYVDARGASPGAVIEVSREAVVEGRIRREPGLCVGCGRCVVVCSHSSEAGDALELGPAGEARPKQDTLRSSGCTFCGQCVLVCPTGALTAPGEAGAAWLAGRRERSGLAAPILPPEPWSRIDSGAPASLPEVPGVFQLLDERGNLLYVAGVADLRRGLALALRESVGASSVFFMADEDPLYTQRESECLTRYAQEHGHLPPGNDMGDDLFDDLDDDF